MLFIAENKLYPNNPVIGEWMLAKNFVEYEHSRTSFYKI